MKCILKKYEQPMFQTLNSDGWDFKLTMDRLSFFGLFRKETTTICSVSLDHIDSVMRKWDELIESEEVIEL